MTRTEFRQLFQQALESAAEQAERRLGSSIPRSYLIELHAPGAGDSQLDIETALQRLYLHGNRFYRIIDIAITQVMPDKAVAFVRVSGHAPVRFSQTWDPNSLGPFKQLQAEHVEDHRVHSG